MKSNGKLKAGNTTKPRHINVFVEMLKDVVGKRVRVHLTDGEVIDGFCTAIKHDHLNFFLNNPKSSEGKPLYPLILIRGNSIKVVEVLE